MNEHIFTRDLTVPGTFNLRDLGGYATGIGSTRWRRILRSGGLEQLQDEGIAALRKIGVTRVIDLRFADEHGSHPNPLRDVPGIRVDHPFAGGERAVRAQFAPGAVAIADATGALAVAHPAFEAAMGLLGQILEVERRHRALQPDMQFGNLAFGHGASGMPRKLTCL